MMLSFAFFVVGCVIGAMVLAGWSFHRFLGKKAERQEQLTASERSDAERKARNFVCAQKALGPYRDLIEKALLYSNETHTFWSVVKAVAEGKMQAWPLPHSVVITDIQEFPAGRILHIFIAAGTMTEIEAIAPVVLTWGKQEGCYAATMTGRPGWARSFLTRTGWKVDTRVTLLKDIEAN